MVNPFQAMQSMRPTAIMQRQMQQMMEQARRQNPQLFQKYEEMTAGKNEGELKDTAMNFARERGVDLKKFASQFGISI